jgi:ABC-type glycerol-3-phosphate transport system permease component
MANTSIAIQESRRRGQALTLKKGRLYLGTLAVNLIFLLIVMLTAFPFLYMTFSAFKPNAEIFGTPITFFPAHPTFDNMYALLTQFPFGRWAFNTAVVAIIGTFSSVLLSSLAGFAFAKYNFRFKNIIFTIMLATMLIPYQVLLVPQFDIIRSLHWTNTFQALIIPRAVDAFGIFLMRQYTVSLPDELLDAARVDGAGEFNIWWRIVLPLVRPGLAIQGILAFTALWNDFIWPSIVTTNTSMFVINLGISSLVSSYDSQYGILLSGATLGALPIIIMFLFFQRQFLQGLTQGAMK